MNSEIRYLIIHALRFAGFAAAVLAGLLVASSALTSDRHFENWETEANLPYFPDNSRYDVVMMGISHARIFSRDHNHERVEQILGKKMINLAQGGGYAGLDNQLMHLNFYLDRGNTAENMVIVLSPMLMYNRNMDRTRIAFEREPLQSGFFRYVAAHGVENRWTQLAYYTRSKLFWNWLTLKPVALPRMDKVIAGLDSAAMARTMPSAFPAGLDAHVFKERAAVLNTLFDTAKTADMHITVIIPAALFGTWPGHDQTMDYVRSIQQEFDLTILDLSRAYPDNKLYYDHHHLNTDGVEKAADTLKQVWTKRP